MTEPIFDHDRLDVYRLSVDSSFAIAKGYELAKNVRKWDACLLGLLTPFAVILAMASALIFVEIVGEWICLPALFLPLLVMGELIAKFSCEQTIR